MSERRAYRPVEKILGWSIPILLTASGTVGAIRKIDAAQAYVNTASVEAKLTPEQDFRIYIEQSKKNINDCETELCPINDQGHELKKSVALAFVQAQEIAGKRIELSGPLSANRTKPEQQGLYDCYIRKDKGCFPAFHPDHPRANHTNGEAIDVRNWRDPIVKNALFEAKWIRPYGTDTSGEPWHFEKRRN
jgi:hypothetical protein